MRRYVTLGVCVFLAASIAWHTPLSAAIALPSSTIQQNGRVFDAAWTGVRRNFHDADAVDHDWSRTRRLFRTEALAAVDEVDLYRVINSMLRTLGDPHTMAVSPFNVALSNAQKSELPPIGVGIGFVSRDDGWHVVSVVTGGPGDTAGLKIGSVVLEVNARPFDGMLAPQQFEPMELKVRDPDGSVAARRLIPLPPIGSIDRDSREIQDGILYIEFGSFDAGTADWVRNQIDAHPTAPSVVLDLRGNGGGSLREAVKTISLFVDQPFGVGRMVSRGGRHVNGCNRALQTPSSPQRFSGPVVVLVDRYSFSSAEVVASVLQSYGRAKIVGEPSGREVMCMGRFPLPDGGELRVSVAAFFTPDGRSLNDTGVIPDALAAGLPDQRRVGPDLALEEAVRILSLPTPP